jgi:hypothetical protein
VVIAYLPARLRQNSDRPTAITNVLVATSGSSSRTGVIALGTPTCSARTRQGHPLVVDAGVNLVQPGGGLLAQRPQHEPPDVQPSKLPRPRPAAARAACAG